MKMIEVSAKVFEAMQRLDIATLATFSRAEIRPVLPSLVRMSLLSPLDNTKMSMESRKQILKILINIETVNNIVSYLQVNYHDLEQELKKELVLRQKGQQSELGLQSGIALDLERADVPRKVHVVLSEVISLQWQLAEQPQLVHPELLEDEIFLEEVVDILCIAVAELPSLVNIFDVTDTLTYVHNGHGIVCTLIANFPDNYRDVVLHVIMSTDEESTEGKLKLALLNALGELCPTQALAIRGVCVENLKAPSFMLRLCLKNSQDLVGFLTGLLLGNDQNVRSWFALYVRSSQKRKVDALTLVRQELLQQLHNTIKTVSNASANDEYAFQGAVFLRLYCALRGISGLKFNDDEVAALSMLMTSRPRPTAAGISFVSFALCTLIACPSLVATPALETKAVEWLQWLIKEEAFFGKTSDTTSLGETLLLLAIHFHNNQITAISELVCSILAMRIPIRPNSTNRIKQVFTQDLFTEQVIASHAVRVPVTVNLNANIMGYLPVHCFHQLLKSRTFLKHKVPIKAWIYKQICNSVRPLHPVMPVLIEVFVNTLIVPNHTVKVAADQMHKPFSDQEILSIFKNSKILRFNGESSNCNNAQIKNAPDIEVKCDITAQLLILYYLVYYEDLRQSNLPNATMAGKKLQEYSINFLSELPMKYLLHKAQQHQADYAGLFHPLLHLIIANHPHLSMVDDWLDEHYTLNSGTTCMRPKKQLDATILNKHLKLLKENPGTAIKLFKLLLKVPIEELTQYADLIVRNIPTVFQKDVSIVIKDLYMQIWLKLNSVMPLSFWKNTLNAVYLPDEVATSRRLLQNEDLLNPLQVLRCSHDVFTSPHLLKILLRILQGSLAASKAHLNIQLVSRQMFDKNGQLQSDSDREEWKTNLIASQESAAVHILLEVLADIQAKCTSVEQELNLQESQGIICSFIHQTFISEPSLAKLVHYQTYPREVIPMMVSGVPSMHICIAFVNELLNTPEMEKQVFTLDLASHLVLTYSIPKSLSVTKFCINAIQTALTQLTVPAKCLYISNVLPSLLRFAEAFPVLADDCINILFQTGRSLRSQLSLGVNSPSTLHTSTLKEQSYKDTAYYVDLIEKAFESLTGRLVHKENAYE